MLAALSTIYDGRAELRQASPSLCKRVDGMYGEGEVGDGTAPVCTETRPCSTQQHSVAALLSSLALCLSTLKSHRTAPPFLKEALKCRPIHRSVPPHLIFSQECFPESCTCRKGSHPQLPEEGDIQACRRVVFWMAVALNWVRRQQGFDALCTSGSHPSCSHFAPLRAPRRSCDGDV